MRWARSDGDPGDILVEDDSNGTPWVFVEGSISVSASILMANAVAGCGGCRGWPIIGFFKNLTEQEDGVIITGMALRFPTALAFYLGGKMVFAAYRDYKRWRNAWIERARREGREEGREDERARLKRELTERGVALDPEAEQALFGESDRQP